MAPQVVEQGAALQGRRELPQLGEEEAALGVFETEDPEQVLEGGLLIVVMRRGAEKPGGRRRGP